MRKATDFEITVRLEVRDPGDELFESLPEDLQEILMVPTTSSAVAAISQTPDTASQLNGEYLSSQWSVQGRTALLAEDSRKYV